VCAISAIERDIFLRRGLVTTLITVNIFTPSTYRSSPRNTWKAGASISWIANLEFASDAASRPTAARACLPGCKSLSGYPTRRATTSRAGNATKSLTSYSARRAAARRAGTKRAAALLARYGLSAKLTRGPRYGVFISSMVAIFQAHRTGGSLPVIATSKSTRAPGPKR
jgi:hypothetical protein